MTLSPEGTAHEYAQALRENARALVTLAHKAPPGDLRQALLLLATTTMDIANGVSRLALARPAKL